MRVEGSHREPPPKFRFDAAIYPPWAHPGPSVIPSWRRCSAPKLVKGVDIRAPIYTAEEREQQKVLGFGAEA